MDPDAGGGGPRPLSPAVTPGGGVRSQVPIFNLICWAYGIDGAQLSGGPSWIHSDRYDIQAKAEKIEGGKETVAKPLRYQDVLLYPHLGNPLRAETSPSIVLFMTAWPSAERPGIEALVEVLRDGRVLRTVPAGRHEAGPDGRLQLASSLPLQCIRPAELDHHFNSRLAEAILAASRQSRWHVSSRVSSRRACPIRPAFAAQSANRCGDVDGLFKIECNVGIGISLVGRRSKFIDTLDRVHCRFDGFRQLGFDFFRFFRINW
jgi:hypothetical protein